VVEVDDSRFEESMKLAVEAIGRPIPHFNIFPLYEMYKKVYELGEKDLVLGDGADETMCGYARDLIINYLYKVYEFEAFENYHPMIDKLLPPMDKAIELVTGKKPLVGETITDVDMRAMRPDMDDMANGIAKRFGITNHRPYQDNIELDEFMLYLPEEYKINNVEYGKYLLRLVASDYLPEEIAWRKVKVGGIVYPVNIKRNWLDKGEFNKERYLDYQKNILEKNVK
jgi:asparagine synthetase B (glutamine-hydrolysing)